MYLPATPEVRKTFERQIAIRGGTVTQAVEAEGDLFLRATLPMKDTVRAGDNVQGGVALRSAGPEIQVHPYVFREVCQNGAIWAQSLGTQRIERVEFSAATDRISDALAQIEAAIGTCAQQATFRNAVTEMRESTQVDADIDLLLHIAHATDLRPGIFAAIRRFHADRDQSLYGLMNAVTSVARDTPDPNTRWRLEELGGAVPAFVRPSPQADGAAAQLLTVG